MWEFFSPESSDSLLSNLTEKQIDLLTQAVDKDASGWFIAHDKDEILALASYWIDAPLYKDDGTRGSILDGVIVGIGRGGASEIKKRQVALADATKYSIALDADNNSADFHRKFGFVNVPNDKVNLMVYYPNGMELPKELQSQDEPERK